MFQDIEKWPIGHFAFNAHFLSEHEGNAKTMKPSPLPRDGDHGFAAQWQRCRCEQYIKQASDIEDHGKGHRTKQNHVLKYRPARRRSEEHTSELKSLMRISYAVFSLKKKKRRSQQPY